MKQRFKCFSCGTKFEAEDNGEVRCPKCKSDNFAPCKVSFVKPLIILFVTIFVVAIGLFVAKSLKDQKVTEQEGQSVSDERNDQDTGSIQRPEPIPSAIKLVLDIQHIGPSYDKKSKSYSLKVWVSNVDKGADVTYELCQTDEPKKVIATSTNGEFKSVKPATNEMHSYWVFATAQGSSNKKEIAGFEPVKEVEVDLRITKEQLQQMINRRDQSLNGGNKLVSTNVTFHVTGDDYHPDTFTDIYTNLKFETWKSVIVTQLGYDSSNRVNSVFLQVTK